MLPGPWPADGGADGGYWLDEDGLTFGPFVTVGAALYPLPVLAFVAAAVNARRVARAMLGLTCLAVLAILVAPLAAPSIDAERPQLYLLVVLGLLAALAAAGYSATASRRELFGAVATHGLLLAGATALSVSSFHRTYPGSPWNRPLHAYRGYGGLLDTVEMIVPAAVTVGALLATAASVRRPGWIVATFTIGGIWSILPIAESIRYDRWGWESNYTGLGFAFVFGLITLAAVVDLFRAAGLKVVRTSDLPHKIPGSPTRPEPNTFTARSTPPGPPPAP
ncbi:hypothetical protein CC117_02165 [Parafrankia colletiae]|uniref:Uncharacterized protein n=1 Tax=Parafrankia colletiae TaxID=573497 RepID=A0A1S1RL63_9ACTN|nr:hypothetical protein CC117_02165 [Parafrankia colletiae]